MRSGLCPGQVRAGADPGPQLGGNWWFPLSGDSCHACTYLKALSSQGLGVRSRLKSRLPHLVTVTLGK